MIGIFTERVRKIMGWCPQEKVVYKHDDVYYSKNALCTITGTFKEKHQYMDIPVQMFDWRIFAAIFSSIGLLLFGIYWSNEYVILLSLLLFALLFVLDRTEISVAREMLTIRTPVLGEKRIPESDIEKVESFENYGHKHRIRTLISLTLLILIVLTGVSRISIMGVMFSISTLLLIYVIYAGIRRSYYPNIIKFSARGRDIIFYPRNEHDFLMLLSIAPEKLKSQK